MAVNLHILLVQVPREHFLNQAHIDRDGEGRVGHTVGGMGRDHCLGSQDV